MLVKPPTYHEPSHELYQHPEQMKDDGTTKKLSWLSSFFGFGAAWGAEFWLLSLLATCAVSSSRSNNELRGPLFVTNKG